MIASTITRSEIMDLLGLGKKSKSAFWRKADKLPHAFVIVEQGKPPKPHKYDRVAFMRWLNAKKIAEGKE